jgi:hypothetical protein
MITQARALHFFCFCANATIPNINHNIANGTHKNAHITVSDKNNPIILSTRLVVESPDFCSVVFVFIKISLNNKLMRFL